MNAESPPAARRASSRCSSSASTTRSTPLPLSPAVRIEAAATVMSMCRTEKLLGRPPASFGSSGPP
eukprot:12020567-Prorocentrum_lima.AAC.1